MVPHISIAFLICSTLILFLLPKMVASAPITMCNCKSKCGEVDIHYPFGVKKGCYLDETFKVTCNESTGAASLASLHWEVDNISISSHSLRRKDFNVMSVPFRDSRKHILEQMGDHYFISYTRNKFVAKGCNFFAYLIDDETKDYMGACGSIWNTKDNVPSCSSSCSGLNCCQMEFPKHLRNLSIQVETYNHSFQSGPYSTTFRKSWAYSCVFLTFVDKDFPLKKMDFSACKETYFVPVIYEWVVGKTSCNKTSGRADNACGRNTECTDFTEAKGYRCKCRNGYQGNPYLQEGCQDIDECKDPIYNNCQENKLCVNTAGSYFCLPNNRHLLELLIPLGTSLAFALLVLVAIGLWIWGLLKNIKDRKSKQKFFKRNGGLLLQQQISSNGGSILPELTLFKIEELEKATDKFSETRIIGKGGLGTVYKGMLSDGKIIAVKRANITHDSQIDQFINEVFILSQINHRHIVKLLGCCLETEVPLLVYEYISNGTLSQHIHDENNISTVSWENRLRIAAEVAGALAYLHSCASTAIFHRDIKSTNILLDENYKAVISDFGLSRSVSIDRTHLTTLVGGTFGYLDPEYFRCGQLNDKSDVYAFGVVLAEILTGQKAVSSNKDDKGLALRFRSAVKGNSLFEILDEVVAYEGQKEEVIAVAKLAKRCLKVNAQKRPSMKEVAAELDQLRIPGHQESFPYEQRSVSENFHNYGIDSEAEDDQASSRKSLALFLRVETM